MITKLNFYILLYEAKNLPKWDGWGIKKLYIKKLVAHYKFKILYLMEGYHQNKVEYLNIVVQYILRWGGPVNVCKHLLVITTRYMKTLSHSPVQHFILGS